MPPKKKTDSRAPFAGLADDELRDHLHVTHERIRIVGREAGKRTREAAETTIAQAQEQAGKRFAALAPRALDAAVNAAPGSVSERALHEAASVAFVASDAFGDALRQALAAELPTEADLAPAREELAQLHRRVEAIETEQALRAIDARQAQAEAERASLVQVLDAERAQEAAERAELTGRLGA